MPIHRRHLRRTSRRPKLSVGEAIHFTGLAELVTEMRRHGISIGNERDVTPETHDPDVFHAIQGERRRQQVGLEMIASRELHQPGRHGRAGLVPHQQVRRGLPRQALLRRLRVRRRRRAAGHRSRCCKLFGADHANVQPHSGAQANMAVFFAALQPGDTILGLDLAHGGHLTHGMQLNFSGKYFKVVGYGVRARRPAHRLRPGRHAGPRAQAEADRRRRQRLSARDRLRASSPRSARKSARCSWWTWPTSPGLVAAKLHPNPVPHADFVTSTTHKTLRGPRGGVHPVQAGMGRRRSTRPSSPACRAGRSCTSSPPRRSPSARRCSRSSRRTPRR